MIDEGVVIAESPAFGVAVLIAVAFIVSLIAVLLVTNFLNVRRYDLAALTIVALVLIAVVFIALLLISNR